jgi:RNA polymerase sigma-70 factor (ECF subfamily)
MELALLPRIEDEVDDPIDLGTEAVRRAQSGDSDAFEGVYRAHVGRVHALCLRMSGDAEHAQSLTQDVFVRAWEKLSSFRGDSRFSTWLHRLAINVVL